MNKKLLTKLDWIIIELIFAIKTKMDVILKIMLYHINRQR